jgi:nitrite reductase (NADH) small subunit
MMIEKQAWVDVGALEDIPAAGARMIRTNAGCLAVFRTVDDAVFALEDRCPHRQGPLSQGIVHDRRVTCPLHNWVISLESGEVEGPDEGSVRTIPVRVEKGRLMLDLALLAPREA